MKKTLYNLLFIFIAGFVIFYSGFYIAAFIVPILVLIYTIIFFVFNKDKFYLLPYFISSLFGISIVTVLSLLWIVASAFSGNRSPNITSLITFLVIAALITFLSSFGLGYGLESLIHRFSKQQYNSYPKYYFILPLIVLIILHISSMYILLPIKEKHESKKFDINMSNEKQNAYKLTSVDLQKVGSNIKINTIFNGSLSGKYNISADVDTLKYDLWQIKNKQNDYCNISLASEEYSLTEEKRLQWNLPIEDLYKCYREDKLTNRDDFLGEDGAISISIGYYNKGSYGVENKYTINFEFNKNKMKILEGFPPNEDAFNLVTTKEITL